LPHPVLVSNGRYSRLGEGGIPSAILPGSSYDKYTVRLAPGDSVLFATDGLHELRNHRDEDFSWDRLGELWCECTRKTADESLDHLFEGAKSFSNGSGPQDDVTAVALKVPIETEAVSMQSSPEGVVSLEKNLESSGELPVCAAISLQGSAGIA
jgi:serine phosphatase RsbU (regulator of sigma subunit)